MICLSSPHIALRARDRTSRMLSCHFPLLLLPSLWALVTTTIWDQSHRSNIITLVTVINCISICIKPFKEEIEEVIFFIRTTIIILINFIHSRGITWRPPLLAHYTITMLAQEPITPCLTLIIPIFNNIIIRSMQRLEGKEVLQCRWWTETREASLLLDHQRRQPQIRITYPHH